MDLLRAKWEEYAAVEGKMGHISEHWRVTLVAKFEYMPMLRPSPHHMDCVGSIAQLSLLWQHSRQLDKQQSPRRGELNPFLS